MTRAATASTLARMVSVTARETVMRSPLGGGEASVGSAICARCYEPGVDTYLDLDRPIGVLLWGSASHRRRSRSGRERARLDQYIANRLVRDADTPVRP